VSLFTYSSISSWPFNFILCPFLTHSLFPHYSLPPIPHPKSAALPHTAPQITNSQSPNPLTKHSSNHQLCLEVSHSRKYGIQLCFSIQAPRQPIPNALNPIRASQQRLHKAPPTSTNHKYTRTIKNTLKHTTNMNNPSSNSNRQISPDQPLHRIPTRITRLLQQAVPLFLPRLPLHRLSLLQRVKRIRTCQPNTQSPITRRARHPTVASRVNADWRATVGVGVGDR